MSQPTVIIEKIFASTCGKSKWRQKTS